jgi:uncharacterized membrane protein YsdA (DUF1294 family)
MSYYLIFGLSCATLATFLYILLYRSTGWNPYVDWLIALSTTSFAIYGLDKLLSKTSRGRCPEVILNLLALLGGFPGGWAGMGAFHHKTNYRKHPIIWLCLILGTIGHATLAYFWFFR